MLRLTRYPFTIKLGENGSAYFEVELDNGTRYNFCFVEIFEVFIYRKVIPEEVGSIIIRYLKLQQKRDYDITMSSGYISARRI